VLDSQSIANIIRGVKEDLAQGRVTNPCLLISSRDDLRGFTSTDITGENCAKVLSELIANTNCNGENSWIVWRLMERLRADDKYFDFRINVDVNNNVDVVTWQTGLCRSAFERYCHIIYLDVCNNENMNSLNMKYLSMITGC
jgi:hypothetical protein